RFVAQPRLVKMAPQPARDHVQAEIVAADWATIRFRFVAHDGSIQARTAPQVIAAGTHYLQLPIGDLPSGTYQLVMENDYGWSATPVVVVR
ncbi:MAG: hypothetical protein JNJ94_03130, partial [Chlorobi bacterium]|nr:hypothetical protein [Chlorobiota bacterium]